MFLILLVIFASSLYLLVKRHYAKWQRLNIPYDEPNIPFGSLLRVKRKELHLALVLSDIYERFAHVRFVGIFLLIKPAILVRDLKLVRQILINDFGHFHDRGVYVDEKHDQMSANLFSLKGDLWRNLRAKLTPSFSSGKLKAMLDTVNDVAEKVIDHVQGQLKGQSEHTLEIKGVLTTYTIDIVGSAMFGLEIDSFANPNNEFREIADRLYNEKNILRNLRVLMTFIWPTMALVLSRLGVNDPFTESLRAIAKKTIEFREKHRVYRKDLLQSLIQLRNTGKISDDFDDQNLWSTETSSVHLKSMSIDMIASNLSLFYLAGSETTSATASFTLYELAMCPQILAKAQGEVNQCLLKHNLQPQDKLTYEALQDMKYLDLCINETTRKYPAAPFLNRECTKDYKIPETDIIIKKGTAIIVSLLSIHRDEQHFTKPLEYRPERCFDNQKDYNADAFMPFGAGPRQCIAQRMGVLNAKVVLAKILANFNIAPIAKKELEFAYHTSPILIPKEKLQITLSQRY